MNRASGYLRQRYKSVTLEENNGMDAPSFTTAIYDYSLYSPQITLLSFLIIILINILIYPNFHFRHCPQILDDPCMDDFIPFLVVLLCNYNYIANPYLAAKLIEVRGHVGLIAFFLAIWLFNHRIYFLSKSQSSWFSNSFFFNLIWRCSYLGWQGNGSKS